MGFCSSLSTINLLIWPQTISPRSSNLTPFRSNSLIILLSLFFILLGLSRTNIVISASERLESLSWVAARAQYWLNMVLERDRKSSTFCWEVWRLTSSSEDYRGFCRNLPGSVFQILSNTREYFISWDPGFSS